MKDLTYWIIGGLTGTLLVLLLVPLFGLERKPPIVLHCPPISASLCDNRLYDECLIELNGAATEMAVCMQRLGICQGQGRRL